jgi:hypothetical protein
MVRRVDTLPLPLHEKGGLRFDAARAAVLEGMGGVVRGYGTAQAVHASLPGGGFDFVAKTGTLDSPGLRQTSSFLFAGSGSPR